MLYNYRPMNKQILKKNEQQALSIRTFIAATTDIITKTDLADGFGISRQTLYRYSSADLQEQNRANSKEQYKRILLKSPHCRICPRSLRRHPRCSHCRILLHDMDTDCVGRSSDMKTCYHCIKDYEPVQSQRS